MDEEKQKMMNENPTSFFANRAKDFVEPQSMPQAQGITMAEAAKVKDEPESGSGISMIEALAPAIASLAGYAIGGYSGGAAMGEGAQKGVSQYRSLMDKQKQFALDKEKQKTDAALKAALYGQKVEETAKKATQEDKLFGLKTEELDLKKQELAEKAKAAANKGAQKLTVGQEAADRAFGKDYQEWSAQGGYSGVEKQLAQLEGAKELLKTRKDLVGPAISTLPDAIRKRSHPESVAVQQQVEQAVQNTLRATLGAQFTEKEGERIMRNSYDPALSEIENIKKLDNTINELRTRAEEKNAAASYFEENGTLTGYKPTIKKQAAMSATSSPQDAQAKAWAKQNEKDPRAAKIIEGLKGKGLWP